jgi:hypothetical protein
MECWNNGIMNKKEKVSNPNIPSFQYSIVPKVDDLVKSQNWDGKVKSSRCQARKT